jgi:hypothetical protein
VHDQPSAAWLISSKDENISSMAARTRVIVRIDRIDRIVENSFVGPGATVYPAWAAEGFPVDNERDI